MQNHTTNRREFLKVAAILGASLSLGASPLLATDSKKQAMPTRILGKGDYAFEVSALAFGLMGLNYHRSKVLSEREAAEIVARCVDNGITLFDTAQVYGPDSNEILAGKILKPYKNKVFITTKFGFGANAD
ncbi:MAG: aldo/keto reductase, partial [Helicobacter sp.]|nr:aldo/keto reductase [Helicobacter sp.]